MSAEARGLRKRLRARGRALGDRYNDRTGTQQIDGLVELAAYEQWHRLLFTRFLAENGLLHADEAHGGVPVTLQDCEDLAPELGARDGFELACRFAARTLPGIFRQDDPVLEFRLAPNDEVALRKLLDALPAEVFRADDALGWTYQFWQAKRKEEVNDSGQKIGAAELPAVTQLFTEDYMVEFLLHNTLGAWWAGKRGPITASSEEQARQAVALPAKDGLPAVGWAYLRFVQDEATGTWRPAAGSFEGWPRTAQAIRFVDPCMGSGHFPVFALPLLARLRLEEEALTGGQAVYGTLRDNIYGLELDPRCTQIGAFNLALTAWKLGGWQALPPLHVACSGLAPQTSLADWVKLAGRNERLRAGMEQLYRLFQQAPVLGSLINPQLSGGDLLEASFAELEPLLAQALADERADDETHELAVTAQGIAKAAEILASQFTLVATNVPYLGLNKQDETLRAYCSTVYPDAKADLATCVLRRCLELCGSGKTVGVVTPQSWLFLGTYKKLRQHLLSHATLNAVARLSHGAFGTISGEVVNPALVLISKASPMHDNRFLGSDASGQDGLERKAHHLSVGEFAELDQLAQVQSADSRIILSGASSGPLLMNLANSYEGIGCGDLVRFSRAFTEVPTWGADWRAFRGTTQAVSSFSGCESIIYWQDGRGDIYELAELLRDRLKNTWQRGCQAWNKQGVAINRMGELLADFYEGEIFDSNIAAIIPKAPAHLLPIWLFVSSDGFREQVRKIDQSMKITNVTFLKVPFDLAFWQQVAAERYPDGLPKPHSDDPSQWLFNGHPKGSHEPLHVAVARLVGYRWPRQTGSSFPDCPAQGPDGLEAFADDDGVVCLPPLNREQPAATRLRALLAADFGPEWSPAKERDLLAETGSEKTSLEEWLRDEFFEQHCALFHHRPFVWHIWDGRKDGFQALVHYHRLDHALLQKLTYSYLGDWIRQQEQDAKANKAGAAERLGAAKTLQTELAAILKGEPPYDLFIRWKPLKDQPLGWHPDLNDGVRLNIRPFMQAEDVGKRGAGVLRAKPNIKWEKDRGTEPERPKADFPWFWSAKPPATDFEDSASFSGARWNDVHFTLDAKRGARKRNRS